MVWIKAIIDLIGGWFKYLSDSRLIELGEKRKQENVDKAQREATKAEEEAIDAANLTRTRTDLPDDLLAPPEERR